MDIKEAANLTLRREKSPLSPNRKALNDILERMIKANREAKEIQLRKHKTGGNTA